MRVTCALAWFQSRRLLLHPVLLVGAAISVLSIVLGLWGSTVTSSLAVPLAWDLSLDPPLRMVPLAVGGFLAAGMIELRDRGHGIQETTGVTPVGTLRRTAGLLLAAGTTATVGAVFLILFVLVTASVSGPLAAPSQLRELAVGPVTVGLCTTAGVLLARLRRSLLLLLLVGVLGGTVGLLGVSGLLSFSGAYGDGYGAWAWTLPLVLDQATHDVPVFLRHRPVGAHLVYLAGLWGTAVVIALWRSGLRPRAALPGTMVAVLIATAGWAAQLQPPPKELRQLRETALFTPEDLHVCADRAVAVPLHDGSPPPARSDSTRVEYCWFEPSQIEGALWAEQVEGVLTALPADVETAPLRLQHRFVMETSFLSREESQRLWQVAAEEGKEHLLMPVSGGTNVHEHGRRDTSGLTSHTVDVPVRGSGFFLSHDLIELRTRVAVAALGIEPPTGSDELVAALRDTGDGDAGPQAPGPGAPEPWENLLWWQQEYGPPDTQGNAEVPFRQLCGGRAMLMLWLAAQENPAAREQLQLSTTLNIWEPSGRYFLMNPEPLAGMRELPVLWDTGDARLASQLLDLPDGHDRARVHANWETLLDPSTSRAHAAQLLGLPVPQDPGADTPGTC